MKTITIETPALFADHHVVEVRKKIFELPGVNDVYASSAFHVVEVSYDPEKINEEAIIECLMHEGYLNDLDIPRESGQVLDQGISEGKYFRHTQVFETTNQVVTFGQRINYSGRPLWNCPGIGIITNTKLMEKMEE
jgi:copper chaperone CopZ